MTTTALPDGPIETMCFGQRCGIRSDIRLNRSTIGNTKSGGYWKGYIHVPGHSVLSVP